MAFLGYRNGRAWYQADFRTHAKYAKRLYYAFRPLWWALHAWDLVADSLAPRLSFGFSTLTAYPDAHPESATVDGRVRHLYASTAGQTWGTTRGAAGTQALDDENGTGIAAIGMFSDSVSDKWRHIWRSIFLFDTSAIGSDNTVESATLSLYGSGKSDGLSAAPDINIYASTPASNTALASGDYAQLGTTAFATAISYASWASSYNAFALNASGITAVSKTGISKFGARNANYDVANVAPTWGSNLITSVDSYMADESGTSNDPKLVVTYSTVITQAIDATASGVATIGRIVTYLRTLSVVAEGLPTIARIVTYYKALTVTAIAVPSLIGLRILGMTLTVSATAIASMTRVTTFYRVLSTAAAAVTSMTRLILAWQDKYTRQSTSWSSSYSRRSTSWEDKYPPL